MDTITHGIAGALIAKAAFGGREMIPPTAKGQRSLASWALTLGAMFPDSDVLRDMLSRNPLLMITWHRSITHSLLLMPVWSVLLAALTGAIARSRKWESPSFVSLTGLYAVGILSHIVLDLVTTYGTMIWSPFEWSRPAWDILFILDFTFTAILLIPQLLAWAYEDADRSRSRAKLLWLIFTPIPFLVSRIAQSVGAPISSSAILIATVLSAGLFLLPAARGWGLRVGYENWNRAGLALAVAYLLAASYAHHVAMERVERFAAEESLQVENIGALPFPPSFWHWDGLVLTPRGVYEIRMDLSDRLFRKDGAPEDVRVLEHTYYPDAPSNEYIAVARQLPEVQKVLWFARFPVTRFHKEGDEAVVEFSDLRFPQMRPDRPASFTYRVRLSGNGQVVTQGWARP